MNQQAKDHHQSNLAPRPDWKQVDGFAHFVQFYESENFLMDCVADFLEAGFTNGEICIVVATESHIESLERRLRAAGYDVAALRASRQYFPMDAIKTLGQVMGDVSLDGSRFAEVIGDVLKTASERRTPVRIFGEMVGLLWIEGSYDAAIKIEELWNQLRLKHSFLLFCAYPLNLNEGESQVKRLSDICRQHTQVIPGETYAALHHPDDQLRAIVRLQQIAHFSELENEDRKAIEKRLRISETRYRFLFQTAVDGILLVEPATGRIIDANPSAARLLGSDEAELVGKDLSETGLYSDREAMIRCFAELTEGQRSRYDQVQIRTREGHNLDIEFSNSLFDEDGERLVQCDVRDITDRKRDEEAVAHLAAIVESSDDAIVSKSLEGTILSWNQGANRIFGYSAEETIGRPIYLLIPPERFSEEPVVLERLKRGERVDHFETIRVKKDKQLVDVSLTVSPIKDRHGKIIGASKIARDITERKRSEAERDALLAREQSARADAEKANQAKDEFLALVSHELRTPLNAILGWIWMARSGKLDEATIDRALETIERNAKAQAQLIEDLLDISRITTGKLRLDLRPVDVAAVVSECVDAIRPAAESKGLSISLENEIRHARVLADTARLNQIISNLLTNAVKFTPGGGQILVVVKQVDGQVHITVSDTGQGIETEFLPFVFERFRQGDGTLTRKHGGLGLGLAIVRHLVAFHGGSVEVHSDGVDLGSTFLVKLPIQTRNLERIGHTGSFRSTETVDDHLSGAVEQLKGLKILIVDDDTDAREMLTIVLQQQGADVTAASSAVHAFAVIEALKPDILVSDIEMPGEDGYSLIEKVRAKEAKQQRLTPAIALTAHARLEDRLRALSAGYQAHVAKPIDPVDLISIIDSLTMVNKGN